MSPSCHTTIEATVSLPWWVEMSKASIRCGGPGRPSERSMSSRTTCWRLPRASRRVWSASAASSPATPTRARLHPVAQGRGPLELHLLRRGLHLAGELGREVVALAFEEALHVLDRLGVAFRGLPSRAGRVAAVDEVLQARPREGAVDLDPAGAEREERAPQSQGLAHRGGGVEGAEVARPVLLGPPGHHQPGELLVGGELEERVVLVVPQDDVVAGPVVFSHPPPPAYWRGRV